MSKKNLSITTSSINAVIWGGAVIFACKYYSLLFGSVVPSKTVLLLITVALAVAATITAFLFAALNLQGKIGPKVQTSILLIGTATLLLVYGLI